MSPYKLLQIEGLININYAGCVSLRIEHASHLQ